MPARVATRLVYMTNTPKPNPHSLISTSTTKTAATTNKAVPRVYPQQKQV